MYAIKHTRKRNQASGLLRLFHVSPHRLRPAGGPPASVSGSAAIVTRSAVEHTCGDPTHSQVASPRVARMPRAPRRREASRRRMNERVASFTAAADFGAFVSFVSALTRAPVPPANSPNTRSPKGIRSEVS